MKKIFLVLFTSLYYFNFESLAQKGLKSVIVEKYYVADKQDSKHDLNKALIEGACTYRIFLELEPGYKLQAVYGVPGHELIISTSSFFFNDTINGAVKANDILKEKINSNTTMLDSWISVGAGAEDYFAVLKKEDNNEEVLKNKYTPLILQNKNKEIGLSLTEKDGIIFMPYQSVVSIFGIDSLLNKIFNGNNISAKGISLKTTNGSWGSFGGSIGHMPNTNKIIIAQLTTNGDLYFELNVQLGSPDGKIQRYVAKNPSEKELTHKDLIYHTKY
jgi:hypothetical protein